ncbi:sensor histidine kinase [Propionibacterium australiense]|uniref:histidine kinase n=1 Tax=Propionibacterium australiense TaxID=119981 RepID=A0A383S8H7_9ACTN|nr:HAMP domain-containing sensor histidine kinase [Propionibacterium australiense]RLP07159.1 HAMP domain-containing protein [Propionibacterium australiense]RLP07553.1 HAMP domain-containing protein [Propionibacterium australiense]SYZ34133.1 histidine kinase [Propionibacterium australiense]VEH92630.1 Probable sensor histidine kinase TcrY [Propionibacterium australiense]
MFSSRLSAEPKHSAPPSAVKPAGVSASGTDRATSAGDDPEEQPWHPMGRGTLSYKLVIRLSAIVAAVAIILSMFSAIMVHHILVQQVDTQLAEALGLQATTGNQPQDNPPSTGDSSPDEQGQGTSATDSIFGTSDVPLGGLPVGAVVVLIDTENNVQGIIEDVDRRNTVKTSAEVNTKIAEIAADGKPHDIKLPELGGYRIMARSVLVAIVGEDGSTSSVRGTLYVGVPMTQWTHAMQRLILAEAIIVALAIVASAVAATAVVRQTLAPLNRLMTTANTVSEMDLETGLVTLPDRLDARDLNPRNEVGRVGRSFNRMLDNVEDALKAREKSESKVKQFVADASHELRNPLAAIRGYAELSLKRPEQLSENTEFAMNRIASEARRMSSLVDDMLLLARLDAGRETEFTDVDTGEIVLNAVSDAQVSSRDHTWRLKLPDSPLMVHANELQLHQVVANLLSNARKHTPAGTVVTTTVRADGRDAVITVEDNGPGVPPEIIDHVFERFARADAARTHSEEGSTGLGLAIVASVMNAHHGSATVDSHPGYSCFTLRMPRILGPDKVADTLVDELQPAQAARAKGRQGPFRGRR